MNLPLSVIGGIVNFSSVTNIEPGNSLTIFSTEVTTRSVQEP